MATDLPMRKKAETLGVHIREQNGPARAVHVIHQAIQEFERGTISSYPLYFLISFFSTYRQRERSIDKPWRVESDSQE